MQKGPVSHIYAVADFSSFLAVDSSPLLFPSPQYNARAAYVEINSEITKEAKSPPLSPNFYGKSFLERSFCCFANTVHSSGLLWALGSPILPVRVPGTGEQSPHPLEQAKHPWKNRVCGALPSQTGSQVDGTGSIPLQESNWINLSAIITLIVIQ